MRDYEYKLYKKPASLSRMIDFFGILYNHCIALHRRYYRLFHKTPSRYDLINHVTKLKHTPKWSWLNDLPSQAIQDVAERIDRAYRKFFNDLKAKRKCSPPKFRKIRKYRSFTLKQCGCGYAFNGNRIRIGKKWYTFWKSRDFQGKIKTVTVKRDAVGDFYIHVVTGHVRSEIKPKTGKSAGFDFGMKTYLTSSDRNDVQSPLFLKQNSRELKRLLKALSKKKKGSKSRERARLEYARFHRKIQRQRNAFQWDLARKMLFQYDTLCFEDLNLQEMSRRFGRKISDYGFYDFLQKLEYLAGVFGKTVVRIDRWYPSSKTCHHCGYVNDDLKLSDRSWRCLGCGEILDRDRNASLNILAEGLKMAGDSAMGVGSVRPVDDTGCFH